MVDLPLALMEKILKENGAERVSLSAKEELRLLLKKHANELSKEAIEKALHQGRKTVKKEDF